MQSCWTADKSDPNHGRDYYYENPATCHLDEVNGYDFIEGQTSDGYVGYGYVTTTEFSGVPIGFRGEKSEWGVACGFTP